MSKKYYVTLSDAMALKLEEWAAAEDQPPATIIAQETVQAIRQAMINGLIPTPDPLRQILLQLAAGELVTDQELAIIASEHELPIAALAQIRECLKPDSNGRKDGRKPIAKN